MTTLYESILNSTRSGAKHIISLWWESFRKNCVCDYYIQEINGKNILVLDGVNQSMKLEFEHDEITKLPKNLNGIYRMCYRNSKLKEGLSPIQINISKASNCKIDLSNLDFSLGQKVLSLFDTAVRFSDCKNIEIQGLPFFNRPSCVVIENCDNIKSIKNIDAPNVTLQFNCSQRFKIENMKNCIFNTIKINGYILSGEEKADLLYFGFGGFISVNNEYADKLNDLLKNNDIKNLLYLSSHFDKGNGYSMLCNLGNSVKRIIKTGNTYELK
jgi:hypothetical protein